FISDWTKAERSKITGAIRQGYFEGKTTAQIIQIVRGTRAAQYKDGLLEMTYRHAEAVIHTAIQHVASTARMETLKENGDIT
ncbi:phage head morphogenesis protein, partial [Staphylococcus aureus]|nr:phage head morphogenesis protein [Staphylococcus aureus]